MRAIRTQQYVRHEQAAVLGVTLQPSRKKTLNVLATTASKYAGYHVFLCDQCGDYVKSLEAHRQAMHGITVIPSSITVERASSDKSGKCPLCNVFVKNLDKHKRKAHGPPRILTRVATPTASADDGMKHCPYCKVVAPTERVLQAHINRVHSDRRQFSDPRVVQNVVVSPANAGKIGSRRPCPFCKFVALTNSDLNAHVLTAHGGQTRPPNPRKAKNGKPPCQRSTKAPANEQLETAMQSTLRGAEPLIERNLDAKENWGASFRDNGQFGSYPSHDDHDDESFS